MNGLGPALRALREQAGHPSARSFFRSSGGTRTFGCTYKAYLNVEAGRSLPQPRLALTIAQALRLADDSPRARAYVSAYLRSALGSPELCGFLTRAIGSDPAAGEPAALFARASEEAFARRTLNLSPEQADLLYSDFLAYWCFTLLSNDVDHWRAESLAEAVAAKPRAVRAALERLTRARLAARDRRGDYFCPHSGKVFRYPRDKFFVPRTLGRLKAHWDAMAARQGESIFSRRLALRTSTEEIASRFPGLAHAVNGAALYSRLEPAPDSALFTVAVNVRRLPDS